MEILTPRDAKYYMACEQQCWYLNPGSSQVPGCLLLRLLKWLLSYLNFWAISNPLGLICFWSQWPLVPAPGTSTETVLRGLTPTSTWLTPQPCTHLVIPKPLVVLRPKRTLSESRECGETNTAQSNQPPDKLFSLLSVAPLPWDSVTLRSRFSKVSFQVKQSIAFDTK